MNTSLTRSKILITAMVAGLASAASAQSITGTVNSATQGAAAIATPPAPPPPAANPPPPPTVTPPPPPSASVGAGAAAQGAASTVVRPPVAPPASASSAAAANSAVSGSTATGVNANATTNASLTGQTRGLSVATDASRQASVTVNTADTVALIRQSAFAARDNVTAEVQARVDASSRVVAGIEQRAQQGAEHARDAVAKALVEVRAREKALRSSLREAAQNTQASAWGEVQSTLAKDYGAYAQAVASAEAAAGATGSVE